jgi:hypothetical protein
VSNASVEGIETTRTFLSLIAAALSTAKLTSEPVAIKMMSGVPSQSLYVYGIHA